MMAATMHQSEKGFRVLQSERVKPAFLGEDAHDCLWEGSPFLTPSL
jgi:hypothetical protein